MSLEGRACANISEHYPILSRGEHRAVAMLPLCHAMGRNLAITVPRYLQKFAAHLLVGLDQSSWIKRAAHQAAMRVGRRALARRWRTLPAGRAWVLLAALARALVSGQRGPYPMPRDVGVVAPNMGIELDPNGEILVTVAEFFGGYWRDPAATEALYREGKLVTGDVGEWTGRLSLRSSSGRRTSWPPCSGRGLAMLLVRPWGLFGTKEELERV